MVSPSSKSPDGNSSTSSYGGTGVESPSADAAGNNSSSTVNEQPPVNHQSQRGTDVLGVSTEEDVGGEKEDGPPPYLAPMSNPALLSFGAGGGFFFGPPATITPPPVKTGSENPEGEVGSKPPPVFDPPIPPELLLDAPPDPFLEKAYELLQDQLKAAEELIQRGLLTGEAAEETMTYLKAVGAALNAQREQIQLQGVIDAINKKGLSGAMYDSIKDQAQRRINELEDIKNKNAEIAEQAKVGAKISEVMQILGPILIAVSVLMTIASFGSLGPLMIAINVILIGLTVADSILDAVGVASITSRVMGVLTQAVIEVVKAVAEETMSEEDAAIVALAIMVTLVVVVAVVAAGAAAKIAGTTLRLGGAAMTGARAIVQSTTLVMAHTGIVGKLTTRIVYKQIMASKPPAKDEADRKKQEGDAMRTAQMVGMIVNVVFGICAAGSMTSSATKSATRVLDRFSVTMSKVRSWLYGGQTAISLVNAGLGGYQGYIQSTIYTMNGNLAIIKARADAGDEKAQDAIETYKQTLKILQKALNPFIDLLEAIDNLQVKKFGVLRDVPC